MQELTKFQALLTRMSTLARLPLAANKPLWDLQLVVASQGLSTPPCSGNGKPIPPCIPRLWSSTWASSLQTVAPCLRQHQRFKSFGR